MDILSSIGDYIVTWTVSIFNFIIEWICLAVDAMMLPVVNSLPNLHTETAFLMGVVGLCNRFIALDYAVMLFLAYLAFALSLCLINWILGLIPTIN